MAVRTPESDAIDLLRKRTSELLREDAERAAQRRWQAFLADIAASEKGPTVSAGEALRQFC